MKSLLVAAIAAVLVGCAGQVEQQSAPSATEQAADVTDYGPNDCVRVYRINQAAFEVHGVSEPTVGCMAFVASDRGAIDTRNAGVSVEHFPSGKPQCGC